MSNRPRGRLISLTPGRRLVAEWMHHARKIPSLPLARTCSIPTLVAARTHAQPTPSWMAIFLRAYGIVGTEIAELRRAWITFPWARLYEHPECIASVLVERETDSELAVLAAKVRNPEEKSLKEIDDCLRRFQKAPVEKITPFRQLLRLARLPWPLNRFFLWRILSLSGKTRARRMGTFVISSLGKFGVEQIHPLSPLTSYFTFGPIEADGTVTLKVIYDHRVMDGHCVSRALMRIEEVLNSSLLDEVRALSHRRPSLWSNGNEPIAA